MTIHFQAPATILTPGYVITPTNQLASVTLQYVNQTNGPITNALIQYQFLSGPNAYLARGYLLTDSNGFASLAYTDNVNNDVFPEVIEFSSSNYTGVVAYETNIWAYSTVCGDQWLGQQLSQDAFNRTVE